VKDFENKVSNPAFLDAFRQGFIETIGSGEQPVYEVETIFEGYTLNRMTFDTVDQAVDAVRLALAAPGVKVIVEVGTSSEASTPPAGEIEAVDRDDEVVDAEIVE